METQDFTVTPIERGKPVIAAGVVKGNPGETVKIPVSITNNLGIMLMDIEFNYDSTYLAFDNIEVSDKLNGLNVSYSLSNKGAYVVVSSSEECYSEGDIISLVFKISDKAPDGEYPITISRGNIYGSSYEKLDSEFLNGKIVIGEGAGSEPEPKDYTINSLSVETIGASVRVRANVTKNSSRDGEDAIVIAMYKDGVLVDMLFMEAEFAQGQAANFGGMMSAVNGAEIKAFVWDSLDNMIPLSNSKEFTMN